MSRIKKKDPKKKRKIKKLLIYILLVLLVFILKEVIPSFFYHSEVNQNPLPKLYQKGAYHMHSIYSDGKGSVGEITEAAAHLGLNFVILTDHGRPNIQSIHSTSWINGVLLIGGTELSLNCGHLAALGFQLYDYKLPPEPQEAINDIVNENGICFISHPYDDKIPWTDWQISGFTGLEVFSSYSEARRSGFFKIMMFPLKYLFNSKYALLNTMNYPQENIKKWNSLNQSGVYYGIYALDAHAKLPISKNFQLNFPTYQSMFEILTVYVKIPQSLNTNNAAFSASLITSTLKKGNFFNVVEAIAPANGFEAFFIENESGKLVSMGEESAIFNGRLILKLPFIFKTSIKILRNGDIFKENNFNINNQLQFNINSPGVYRVEIYVPDNSFNHLPWIMTNPFFLGVQTKSPPPSEPSKNSQKNYHFIENIAISLNQFKVEKNNQTQIRLIQTENPQVTNENFVHMHFKLNKESPSKKDFWAALSLRKNFNLSDYQGFIFEACSDKKRRFWIEFRTRIKEKEHWYRHSFLVNHQWRQIVLPFNQFYLFSGKQQNPSLQSISSIFFSINNAIAYSGTEGEMVLRNLKLY